MNSSRVEMQVAQEFVRNRLEVCVPKQKQAGTSQQGKQPFPGFEQGDGTHSTKMRICRDALFAGHSFIHVRHECASFAGAQFGQQFQLGFLNLYESFPLVGEEMIHLLVEMADFQLGLEVDLVVAHGV